MTKTHVSIFVDVFAYSHKPLKSESLTVIPDADLYKFGISVFGILILHKFKLLMFDIKSQA